MYTSGNMVNSEFLNGLPVKEAIPTMIEWLEEARSWKEKSKLQTS